jgi:hypothetical protein
MYSSHVYSSVSSSIPVRSPSSAARLQAGHAEPRASAPRCRSCHAVGPCVGRLREPPRHRTQPLFLCFFLEITDESGRQPPPSPGLLPSPDGFAGPEGSARHADPVHSPFFFPFPSRENMCFCSGRSFVGTPCICRNVRKDWRAI